MRVMFVARAIHDMAGGVERMVTIVMNALVARGHQINLFTWDEAGATSFYPMVPEIRWHQLNMGNPLYKASLFMMVRRAKTVRHLVRSFQPDVIVCFQAGPFVAFRTYTAGLGIPVIAAERNAPTRFEYTRAGRWKILTFQILRLAKRILIQCEGYRELYPSFLRDRIVTLPNPVLPANGQARPTITNAEGRFCILSVGRLSYQKNYPVLIEAFSGIAQAFPEWDLAIIGEGEDRSKLEDLIKKKGLSSRISLPGASTSVAEWYISSHVFCLPSRWEGFPNALAEALTHGLPSVGFAGCAGMGDLIIPGQNGLLAEGNDNAMSLAKTLEKLMVSPEGRCEMGETAVKSIKGYSPEEIFLKWEGLLKEAIVP